MQYNVETDEEVKETSSTPDFKLLFESAPGLFLVLKPDLTIVAVSDAYLEATMIKREKVLNKGIFEIFPDNPDDPSATGVSNLKASLYRVLQNKESDSMAVQKYDIRKSESEGGAFEERYWSPINSPVFDDNYDLKYIIHRVEDVTEFMQLKQKGSKQEELIKTQRSEVDKKEAEIFIRAQELQEVNKKLREAERIKSEFFANVSHELRTPLSLIIAPLETLLSDAKAIAEDKLNLLLTINNNALRLLQMVNGLLDFSKLEAGKMQVNREPVDISILTNSVLNDFLPLMEQKGLKNEVLMNIPQNYVMIDRYLYERILFNLLSNAVKFTEPGGKVILRLGLGNEMLHLEVEDTGIGIPESEIPKLFNKFYQIEGSSTRRFEGSGLGLALVKEFTEMLGGKVGVKSTLGKGAVFSVDLAAPFSITPSLIGEIEQDKIPALKIPQPGNFFQEKQTHKKAHKESDLKVLIAEDNVELATYIESLISDYCQTQIAKDGKIALEIVEAWQPDMVLSDIMMPEIDGFTVCSNIKSDKKTAETVVVLVTSLTHREAMIKGWESGADEYLFKPFHPNELVTRVRSLLKMIKHRKEAREALVRSEQKFRSLLESSPDAIVMVNSNGEIIFVNKQVQSWFYYEPEEIVGKLVEILIPDRFKKIHPEHRKNFMANPVSRPAGINLNLFGRRKDGSEFPVDISLTPYGEGSEMNVAASIRDITLRKRAEIEYKFLAESSKVLAESLNYLDSLKKISNLVVPFIADCCVVLVLERNKIVAKATTHCELSKETILKQVGSFFDQKQESPLSAYEILGQNPIIIEDVSETILRMVAVNEEHFILIKGLEAKSFISVPLRARGKIIGILALSMCESNRHFTKDDLKFAEATAIRFAMALDNARLYGDAQNAVKAREDILAIVSHDLKNPLGTIRSGNQLLGKLISKYVEHEQLEKIITSVDKSSRYMEMLISDLLDFSKIEAGTLRLRSVDHPINKILEDLSESFQYLANEKFILLQFEIPTVSLKLKCDPERIKQILVNIVGNAIKFTPEHGKVVVNLKEEDNAFLFSVNDTGPGVPKDVISHLFEKYWQARKTAHMGTGLGLFITKALVEAHGGKIWVESEEGKGAAFYFSIPKK